MGHADEAIAEFRRAIDLEPKLVAAHYYLAQLLTRKGQADEAIKELRTTVELGPKARASKLWRFCYSAGVASPRPAWPRRGLDLAVPAHPRAAPSRTKSTNASNCLLSKPGYPRFSGRRNSPPPVELITVARLCRDHGRPYAAARLYASAFAAQSSLADDLATRNRYDGACAAARAATDPGSDAAGPGEPERAGLRRQALDWLRADLAADRQLRRRRQIGGLVARHLADRPCPGQRP